MAIADTLRSAIPSGGVVGLYLIMFIVGVIVLVVVGGLALLIWSKKRWNIKVEIKLPRSDGRIVNAEWGKGYFNSKQGVVYIKRPGFAQKKVPLKIFDPKRYLQGSDLLTVVQLSPLDYRPVKPVSFLNYDVLYTNDKTGEQSTVKEAVINMESDVGASKAWQTAFDAAAKRAYSLQSFFHQFQTPLSIAIVLVAVFVGIAALWTQLPK
ncbi:hypothetical protein LCGC14_0652070 [marine sediment metagenome]|uniref:Uncharacterized protein n=1 Tax=marine sediment metagenome TaxID=412755 RepID=A0A0F9R186_9ZZZZ